MRLELAGSVFSRLQMKSEASISARLDGDRHFSRLDDNSRGGKSAQSISLDNFELEAVLVDSNDDKQLDSLRQRIGNLTQLSICEAIVEQVVYCSNQQRSLELDRLTTISSISATSFPNH